MLCTILSCWWWWWWFTLQRRWEHATRESDDTGFVIFGADSGSAGAPQTLSFFCASMRRWSSCCVRASIVLLFVHRIKSNVYGTQIPYQRIQIQITFAKHTSVWGSYRVWVVRDSFFLWCELWWMWFLTDKHTYFLYTYISEIDRSSFCHCHGAVKYTILNFFRNSQ